MSCLNATPHCVQYRVDHKYPIDSRLTGLPQLGHFLLPGLCKGGSNQAMYPVFLLQMISGTDYTMLTLPAETKLFGQERKRYK